MKKLIQVIFCITIYAMIGGGVLCEGLYGVDGPGNISLILIWFIFFVYVLSIFVDKPLTKKNILVKYISRTLFVITLFILVWFGWFGSIAVMITIFFIGLGLSEQEKTETPADETN